MLLILNHFSFLYLIKEKEFGDELIKSFFIPFSFNDKIIIRKIENRKNIYSPNFNKKITGISMDYSNDFFLSFGKSLKYLSMITEEIKNNIQ